MINFIGFMAGMKRSPPPSAPAGSASPGAMIGGLITGIAGRSLPPISAPNIKDVVSFALLILVLLVMPTGILGRPEVEKV